MQVLRKFSVEVVNPGATDGAVTAGRSYPVLALDKEGGDLYLLLADNIGYLCWVADTEVTVTNIECEEVE